MGRPVQSGVIAMPAIAPQTRAELKLPYRFPEASPYEDVTLQLYFTLREADGILPAGELVAHEQFVLQRGTLAPLELNTLRAQSAPRLMTNDTRYLIITGTDWRIDIDRNTGFIARYDVAGLSLLDEGHQLSPNFWRAPTDNDMGAGLQRKYAMWRYPELKLRSSLALVQSSRSAMV